MSLQRIPITVMRTGSFDCHRIPSEARCGLAGSPMTFWYEVQVVVDSLFLDDRDFAIDQLDIARYFEYTYGPEYSYMPLHSCERVAIDAVDAMRELAPAAEGVLVRIWGLGKPDQHAQPADANRPRSYIQACWRRADQPPPSEDRPSNRGPFV